MTHEELVEACRSHRASNGHGPAPDVDITEYWCERDCIVAHTCPLIAAVDSTGAQQAQ